MICYILIQTQTCNPWFISVQDCVDNQCYAIQYVHLLVLLSMSKATSSCDYILNVCIILDFRILDAFEI